MLAPQLTVEVCNSQLTALKECIIDIIKKRNKKEDFNLEIVFNNIDTLINLNDDGIITDIFLMIFEMRDCHSINNNDDIINGERELFYEIFIHLNKFFPVITLKILHFIPQFGSWKDIRNLIDRIEGEYNNIDSFAKSCMDLFSDQLIQDYSNLLQNNFIQISLAAKYTPREYSSFWKKNKRYFDYLVDKFFIDSNSNALISENIPVKEKIKYYRKKISELNNIIGTTEVKMCSNNWEEILYLTVPIQCTEKFKKSHTNESRIISSKNFELSKKFKSNYYDYFDSITKFKDNELQTLHRFLHNKCGETKKIRNIIPICCTSNKSIESLCKLLSFMSKSNIIKSYDRNFDIVSIFEDTISNYTDDKSFDILIISEYDFDVLFEINESSFDPFSNNTIESNISIVEKYNTICNIAKRNNFEKPELICWNISDQKKKKYTDYYSFTHLFGKVHFNFNYVIFKKTENCESKYKKIEDIITSSF